MYDVTIEGANVLFSDNAAVLALNNYGTISSCRVINSNITADTGAVLGGMVSRNYCLLYTSGSAFQDDSDSSINDGYPMLKWQDPNATYTVSLSVTPANAVVSFDDEQMCIRDRPSSRHCSTSLPWMAYCRRDFFISSGKRVLNCSNLLQACS